MTWANPGQLWLFPAALAALLLLQLIRSRRREILAGSLLLWRRVAAKEKAPRRRLIVLDALFWLQSAALLSLALALAGPALRASAAPVRQMVVLVDNAPGARARDAAGRPVWEAILREARASLEPLESSVRVTLLCSAPFPKRLGAGVSPAEALALLERAGPALSAPDTHAAWSFALDAARAAHAPLLALSPRAAPDRLDAGALQAVWRTAGPGPILDNIALAAFGSEVTPDGQAAEALIQVRSFSRAPAMGRLVIEAADGASNFREEHALTLVPGAAAGQAVRVAKPWPALRVQWIPAAGRDALPEDDVLLAQPRSTAAPRVRFHGQAPNVEDAFRELERARILEPGSSEPADLEVYVDEVPEAVPASARAALFLAPRRSYGPFEVTPATYKFPSSRLGQPDPVTANFDSFSASLFLPIAEAREITALGNLKPLICDGAGRPLAARFYLPGQRPAFVFAFIPGAGLGWTPEKEITNQPLLFLLGRVLRAAMGSREPYALVSVRECERLRSAELPLDWKPDFECGGVLDPRASALELGPPTTATFDAASFLPQRRVEECELWPLFACLALVLISAEGLLIRRRARARAPHHPTLSNTPSGPAVRAASGTG